MTTLKGLLIVLTITFVISSNEAKPFLDNALAGILSIGNSAASDSYSDYKGDYNSVSNDDCDNCGGDGSIDNGAGNNYPYPSQNYGSGFFPNFNYPFGGQGGYRPRLPPFPRPSVPVAVPPVATATAAAAATTTTTTTTAAGAAGASGSGIGGGNGAASAAAAAAAGGQGGLGNPGSGSAAAAAAAAAAGAGNPGFRG